MHAHPRCASLDKLVCCAHQCAHQFVQTGTLWVCVHTSFFRVYTTTLTSEDSNYHNQKIKAVDKLISCENSSFLHFLYGVYGIGIGAGPAGQVLAGPLLSKVKMKLHFCKKQAMNRSASMIFRLVRLIILLYNR